MAASVSDPVPSHGPLSWRNNNPGNIEWLPKTKWQGQEDAPGEGGRFCRFRTRAHGWRALAVLLRTYKERYKCDTVRKVIARWAPSVENDTEAYIAHVAKMVGVGPDDALVMQDYRVARVLCSAIAEHEGGPWPWPPAELDDGLRMAGYHMAPAAMSAQPETRVATGTAAAGAVAAVVVQLGPHLPVLGGFVQTLGPWLTALVVVLAAAWLAWNEYAKRQAMAA